jgi:uncharacterized protein YdiU (UPF0061 family)
MKNLDNLHMRNSFTRELDNRFYAHLAPTPLEGSHLIAFNPDAASLIDLDPKEADSEAFLRYFSGQQALPGSEPVAMLYAGHQFGHFVPQLGDGRAILLGEVQNSRGEPWELQLKGAGITPFSRRGDGRAVLRSSIREYLCSEAMHSLGIPTTRALCLTGSTEEVYREQIESGAMLLRMAPSHVRFGSFEVFYYRRQFEQVRQLADYLIAHHYPQFDSSPEGYLALFAEVCERTARLLAQWQQVGFAHGVMNTDNMSVLGLTLDYGPFGFLDDYDPGFICNHSDHEGRYAFDQQPAVSLWNLSCLAQAMLPLFGEPRQEAADRVNAILNTYQGKFEQYYWQGMAEKFGLTTLTAEDQVLIQELLDIMQAQRNDYTLSLRALSHYDPQDAISRVGLRAQFPGEPFATWLERYDARLAQNGRDTPTRRTQMLARNPKYILRNYLAQQVIEQAEQGDYKGIETLHRILQHFFDEQFEYENYAAPPPEWGKQLEISCSS